jgi:hypothetical protein
MRVVRTLLISLISLLAAGHTFAHGLDETATTSAPAGRLGRVVIQVVFSTWHPRGRTLSQIEPAIRVKLRGAGFEVVTTPEDSHEYHMQVSYRETRGQQFRIDTFGTIIDCTIVMESKQESRLLHLPIHEESGPYEMGTAPYLEALEKFDTNPYFYFLGGIAAQVVGNRADVTGGLLRSFEDMLDVERRTGEDPVSDHGALQSDTVYAMAVRENTIRELGRLGDSRAVPILTGLLGHKSRDVRLQAIDSLGKLPLEEATKVRLEQVVSNDPDRLVAQAAAAALAVHGPPVPTTNPSPHQP